MWKPICRKDEIPLNEMKAFTVEGGSLVLIVNSGGEYFAYQAFCPHMEVPLEEGFYDGEILTCHEHLWQWRVKTGEPVGLAEAPLKAYPLREEDGVLYTLLE